MVERSNAGREARDCLAQGADHRQPYQFTSPPCRPLPPLACRCVQGQACPFAHGVSDVRLHAAIRCGQPTHGWLRWAGPWLRVSDASP